MNEVSSDLSATIVAELSPRDRPSRDCCDRRPNAAMIKAFEQFNRGEFWEQHETLEMVWRGEADPSIRNFYKGIIQVGVGFHHLTRKNYRGLMKVLPRGINYLKPYAPECYGVLVGQLIQEASAIYHRAVKLGPEGIGQISPAELPKVHWNVLDEPPG